MQEPAPAVVTRKLRGRYVLAGAVMLSLWGASLVAVFQDGSSFNVLAGIFATLTFLPLALVALWGGISGNETDMQRARNALFVSGGLLLLVATIEVFRRIFFPGN
jgi:hypothetical protein